MIQSDHHVTEDQTKHLSKRYQLDQQERHLASDNDNLSANLINAITVSNNQF